MKIPIISIVLPLYNGATFVKETLEAVAAQTFQDAELIVVDDGSSDDSSQIVEEICGHSSSEILQRLSLVKQENQGVAAARNHGIEKAGSKWIALLDQDDIWLPEKLEVQYEATQKYPDACWHYSAFVRFYADGREKVKNNGSANRLITLERMLSGELFVPPSTVLVLKEIFQEIGGFDSEFIPSDEWDFFLKLAEKFQNSYSEKVLVRFPSHLSSTAKRQKRQIFEAQKIVIEKHSEKVSGSIPTSVIKRRKANILWHLGCENELSGETKKARKYYFEAVKTNPARIKLLVAWIKSILVI